MQRKFLPNLNKLLNLFQRKPSNEDISSDENPLLDSSPEETLKYTLIALMEDLILLLCGTFILLASINILFDKTLLIGRAKLQTVYNDLSHLMYVVEDANVVKDKVTFYKDYSNSRTYISEETKIVFRVLGDSFQIKDLKLYATGFRMTLESRDIISFTYLINRFLNENIVSSITLESASLIGEEDTYQVTFSGVFK